MAWWGIAPALMIAVLVGIGPGLVIGKVLGLRGIALAGLAPAFSVSVIALASVGSPLVGVKWGVLPLIAATILCAALVAAFRYFWHRHRARHGLAQDPPAMTAWWALGLGVGALIIAIRFMIIIQAPDHISQTFDSIFHLNALRYILDTGNASSLELGRFGRDNTFYPGAWHAFASLVTTMSGASIPVGISGTNLVIGALYWPLSCLVLVRHLVGRRRLAIAAAGIVSAAFAAFPYLTIDFGVIFPYFLALALMPAAFAAVLLVAGFAKEPTFDRPQGWIALLGTLPGIALAHPSVLMGLLALCVPIFLTIAYRQVQRLREREVSRSHLWMVLAGWALAFAAMGVLWLEMRVSTLWNPRVSTAHALGELALNAPLNLPIAWTVSGLIIIGIAVLIRRRTQLWFVFVYAMAAFLFIVATGVPYSYFRNGIVGIWYSDPQRLAAQLPIVAVPLSVIGFVWVHDRVQHWRRTRHPSPDRRRAVSLILLAALLVTTQLSNVNAETVKAMVSYSANEESGLLSPDEYRLLKRIDRIVPADVTVAGNPRTGASLVYVFGHRQAMLPHVRGFTTPETTVIVQRLNRANVDPSVCAAVRALNVGYVLDFGDRQVGRTREDFPGLMNLAASGAVRLVDQEGDAKLYRITACD